MAAGLSTTTGSYRAWLSVGSTGPADFFVQATIPYFLPDGVTQIAADFTDLVDGNLENPIDQTEDGTALTGPPPGFEDTLVWTGTDGNGKVSANTCENWFTADDAFRGTAGNASCAGNAAWTRGHHIGTQGLGCIDTQNELFCSRQLRYYCVQQGVPTIGVNIQSFTLE